MKKKKLKEKKQSLKAKHADKKAKKKKLKADQKSSETEKKESRKTKKKQKQVSAEKTQKEKPAKFVIFADTENIGFRFHDQFPPHTEITIYTTNERYASLFPSWMSNDRFNIVDLHQRMSRSKNELDMVIVADLGSRLAADSEKKRSRTTYLILSKDKGFDTPLQNLRNVYPGTEIRRMGVDCDAIMKSILVMQMEKIEPEIPDEIADDAGLVIAWRMHWDYDSFRTSLNLKQLRTLRIFPDKDHPQIWIEHDFYKERWRVYLSDSLRGSFPEIARAYNEADRYIASEKKNVSYSSAASQPRINKKPDPKKIRNLSDLTSDNPLVRDFLAAEDSEKTEEARGLQNSEKQQTAAKTQSAALSADTNAENQAKVPKEENIETNGKDRFPVQSEEDRRNSEKNFDHLSESDKKTENRDKTSKEEEIIQKAASCSAVASSVPGLCVSPVNKTDQVTAEEKKSRSQNRDLNEKILTDYTSLIRLLHNEKLLRSISMSFYSKDKKQKGALIKIPRPVLPAVKARYKLIPDPVPQHYPLKKFRNLN